MTLLLAGRRIGMLTSGKFLMVEGYMGIVWVGL